MSHAEQLTGQPAASLDASARSWPRYVVAGVAAVKLLQALLLILVANGEAIPLVPEVTSDDAWRSLLLPAAGLVLVTMRPSMMAWGTCMTLFVLSLTSQLSEFEVTAWVALSVLGSAIGASALLHPAARRWLRRLT